MTFYFNSCLTEAYQYVVCLLRNWYTDQKLSARWNSQKSYSFRVSNGVRQGGVLSPVLFTSYIDKLLLELRQQGVGCYWNSLCWCLCICWWFGYLGPLCFRFQTDAEMLWMFCLHTWFEIQPCQNTTCQVFCVCCQFIHTPCIKFCGLPLEFSNTVVHLGSISFSNLSDSEDIILHKCRDMVTKFNALLHCFPNLDPTILTNLFQFYCLSFHGSALWNISSRSLQSLEVSFNKVLRRIWKLPHASHTAGLQSFQPSSSTLQQTDLLSWEMFF